MLLFQETKDGSNQASQNEAFSLLKTLGSITGATKLISTNLNFAGAAMDSFVESFNQMEGAVTDLATKFGGSRDMANAIKLTLDEAYISSAELGATWTDIRAIQEGVVDALNTQTILHQESYKDLYAIGQLVNDGTKTSAASTEKLVKSFADAGYGLYNISGEMTKVLNTAREIGVTSVSVYKQLEGSMSQLALFNFENGVQGMAKMAAQAASLRIDMKTTLKLADDLFSPEKAIDMAASMQRLGVQVSSLLDPYKLMDMARNDPAKLQDEILKATKALTYFDEKNQRMAILPGAQGQLRELASALGIGKEELAKMALNAGDLDRKMSQIRFPSSFANEEQKKMVANMAQMSGGTYVVQFEDERGEKVTKQISEISPKDIEQMNKPAKSAVDLQKEANGYLRTLANEVEARKGIIPRKIASQPGLTEMQKKAYEYGSVYVEAAGEVLGAKRQPSKTSGVIDNTGFVSTKQTDEMLTALFGSDGVLTKKIEEMVKNSKGQFNMADITNLLESAKNEMGGAVNKSLEVISDINKRANEISERNANRDKNYIGSGFEKINFTSISDLINTQLSQIGIQPLPPNPVAPNPNTGTNINNTNTGTQTQTQTTVQEVKVSGAVNINVTPGSMRQEVVNALNTAEFQKAITNVVMVQKEETRRLGGK